MKKIVFSGIQPSGRLTIGNYIGVLKQWKQMQEKFSCIYCIVDLHAITTVEKSSTILKKNILDTLAIILACDIDVNKNLIFLQSQVPEHSQLNWILNCFVYHNELKRMTQFKEKYKMYCNNINCGLFNYPVLMASDILLYNTNLVPVGADQKQHLELSRNIAKRFNTLYKSSIFNIPEPVILNLGSRIMSLKNPIKKMSKSDKNKKNIIELLDEPRIAMKKIKEAVTDSNCPPIISYNRRNKQGISNLLEILSSITEINISKLEKEFIGKTYNELKNKTSDAIYKFLMHLQKKYYIYRQDEKFLKKIIQEGTIKARKKAKKKIKEIYKIIGLYI